MVMTIKTKTSPTIAINTTDATIHTYTRLMYTRKTNDLLTYRWNAKWRSKKSLARIMSPIMFTFGFKKMALIMLRWERKRLFFLSWKGNVPDWARMVQVNIPNNNKIKTFHVVRVNNTHKKTKNTPNRYFCARCSMNFNYNNSRCEC